MRSGGEEVGVERDDEGGDVVGQGSDGVYRD